LAERGSLKRKMQGLAERGSLTGRVELKLLCSKVTESDAAFVRGTEGA
jgi:hypothetical protein